MRTAPAAVAIVAAFALTACVSTADDSTDDASGTGGSANQQIAVQATDDACEVGATELPAGLHTFTVTNGGSKTTEFYVYAAGDRVMAEVENIVPSLSRELKVELPAGEYQTACKPGMIGKGIRNELVVTGTAPKLSEDANLQAATEDYQRYVVSQTDALVTKTGEFVDAVKAQDVEKAKALFPVSRIYWERIEPVAESFGDLDPKIDARDGDLEPGIAWTGFHPIEQALWEGGDLVAMAPIADQLLADVKDLQARVVDLELAPLDLANGAKGLLDEVAASKITGEEDRYSHTDLWDFQSNVQGSKAAIASLRPVIDERDQALGTQLDAQFASVEAELAKYQQGDGFISYVQLTPEQIKGLSAALDGLAEPVSKVAGVVAQ